MATMNLKLILCILPGLIAVSSAARQYQASFQAMSSGYPHAGLVKVYIDGAWGTICASDWDMNDAEVVCRELGKGYPNTITVSGTLPSFSASKCLSSVKCYGHEQRLSDCPTPVKRTRANGNNDKGIVCFPPPSDAGLRIVGGPDQYSGRVEVNTSDGSWDQLYNRFGYGYSLSEYDFQYIPNICRQLGFGELNWWDYFDYGSSTSMTWVYDCAYGVADHRSCSFTSTSQKYQAFVGCHKPGAINCSAPYIPHDASVEHLRLNYAFGDRINVTCDASDAYFTLQCHNKGLWSGPVVSCPRSNVTVPAAVTAHRHAYCSAPAVPPHSTNQNPRLSYKEGDNINVTCNEGSGWYPLECSDGIWIGQNIVCPNPTIDCNQPIIPAVSSLDTYRSHYKVDEVVNITCKTSLDSILWECHKDGQWRGPEIRCPVSQPISSADTAGRVGEKPVEKWHGRDLITTGLLVAAVIMFVLVLMSMVAFSISFKGWHSGSAKDDKNADRGPLPDVPGGYADYLVGEKSLYTEPYLKPSSIPQGYETYEKPL